MLSNVVQPLHGKECLWVSQSGWHKTITNYFEIFLPKVWYIKVSMGSVIPGDIYAIGITLPK